jgi:hypothetical protein
MISVTPSAAKRKKGKKRRTLMKMVTPSAKTTGKKNGIVPSPSAFLQAENSLMNLPREVSNLEDAKHKHESIPKRQAESSQVIGY